MTNVRVPSPLDPHHVRLLLAVRTQREWTQRQLAGELGVSTSTIRGWENGRSDPHPMFVRLIAALLKPLPKR